MSLVAAEEHELLRAIEKLIGTPLPRREVPGFEPTVLSAPPLDLSGGRGRGAAAAAPRGRAAGPRAFPAVAPAPLAPKVPAGGPPRRGG